MEKVRIGYPVVTLDGEYLGVVAEITETGFWLDGVGNTRAWIPKSLSFDVDYDSVTLLFTESELASYGLEQLSALTAINR
jgi:hypothetical protein